MADTDANGSLCNDINKIHGIQIYNKLKFVCIADKQPVPMIGYGHLKIMNQVTGKAEFMHIGYAP